MRNFLRKWLGIDAVYRMAKLNRDSLILIQEYLDSLASRESCKICGHHRYTKKLQRYDEIERDRKSRRKKAA